MIFGGAGEGVADFGAQLFALLVTEVFSGQESGGESGSGDGGGGVELVVLQVAEEVSVFPGSAGFFALGGADRFRICACAHFLYPLCKQIFAL